MKIIPIADRYAQSFKVTLAGQVCTVSLYQKSTGLYMDLLVNNAVLCTGVVCENLNRVVRMPYTGFVGDLLFYDTQGGSDPSSPGLGSRYVLCYLEAADIAQIPVLGL